MTITAKPGTKLEIPDKAVIADKVISLLTDYISKLNSYWIAIWLTLFVHSQDINGPEDI